jgi:hypothetical protein
VPFLIRKSRGAIASANSPAAGNQGHAYRPRTLSVELDCLGVGQTRTFHQLPLPCMFYVYPRSQSNRRSCNKWKLSLLMPDKNTTRQVRLLITQEICRYYTGCSLPNIILCDADRNKQVVSSPDPCNVWTMTRSHTRTHCLGGSRRCSGSRQQRTSLMPRPS